MPGLYLLQLFESKENCKIQFNNFHGAHITGSVTVDDSNSGENFCGDAGDTTGNSTYTNMSSSSSKAASTSASSSSAMTAAPSNVGSKNVSKAHGTANPHTNANPSVNHGTANPSHSAGHSAAGHGGDDTAAKAMAMAKKAEHHNSGAPVAKKVASHPAFKAGSACGNGWGQKQCTTIIMLI